MVEEGTNTIFLDTGIYWTEPVLPHPKDDLQRYYRVVKVCTNSLPSPIVTITNLAAGTNLTGEVEIGVHIATTNGITFVRYFVDGEEVEFGGANDDGNSSYTINTTEWPNGSHVIFVVAEIATGSETTGSPSTAESGAGTSAIIPVTFDNYIAKWYFSLPGFDPSLGETQRITAEFIAYSCWTLEIVDEFNTTVRTASGSGVSMLFDWEGNDDNGNPTADGTYDFILTADQCTPPEQGQSAPSAGDGVALSPMMAAALEGKTTYLLPSPPMPPLLVLSNGVRMFVPWEDVYGPLSEFDFGGGPVGLRWMGIYACNMLSRENALDMYNKGVLPMNQNLHILLAEETSVFLYSEFGRKWASFMNGGEDGVKHSVIDSWNSASEVIHKVVNPGTNHPVVMSSAYWPDCVNDSLLLYTDNGSTDPSEILFWREQVYPTRQRLP